MSYINSVISPSILQSGLTHITPVEERKVIKKFGMKLLERKIKFIPKFEYPKHVEECVKFVNNLLVGSILEIDIPSKFSYTNIQQVVTEKVTEKLLENDKLMNHLEILHEVDKKNLFDALDEFIDNIQNTFEKKYIEEINESFKKFFISDLPLEFYYLMYKYSVMFSDYIRYLKSIFKRYRSKLFSTRALSDYKLFKKRFQNLKNKIKKIVDEMDLLTSKYFKLLFYLDIWNSDDYEDILEPKIYYLNRVDKIVYYSLFKEYKDKLYEFNQMLAERKAVTRKVVIDKTFVNSIKNMFFTLTFGEAIE